VIQHLVDADLAELLVQPARNRVQQTAGQDGQESEQFSDAHAAPAQTSPGATRKMGARKGCAMVLQRPRNKSVICHRLWQEAARLARPPQNGTAPTLTIGAVVVMRQRFTAWNARSAPPSSGSGWPPLAPARPWHAGHPPRC